MEISGFSFIHNAIDTGIPIIESIKSIEKYVDEIVIVDMKSTDETRQILQTLISKLEIPLRILDGEWGTEAGVTLAKAHSLYTECNHPMVVHFEADEVYDDLLIRTIISKINQGVQNIGVYRLQLEQNFQRCRWYPEVVHRVFHKDSGITKNGHTTNYHSDNRPMIILDPMHGYLWDCCNIFRDSWKRRVDKQKELWHHSQLLYRYTPVHFLDNAFINDIDEFLQGEHWVWKETPFDIPEILVSLVGEVDYRHSRRYKNLI